MTYRTLISTNLYIYNYQKDARELSFYHSWEFLDIYELKRVLELEPSRIKTCKLV